MESLQESVSDAAVSNKSNMLHFNIWNLNKPDPKYKHILTACAGLQLEAAAESVMVKVFLYVHSLTPEWMIEFAGFSFVIKTCLFFLFAVDLQHVAGGSWACDPGLPHGHHHPVVLPGSSQHHHLPLRIPPPLPALPWVPRLPPPQVSSHVHSFKSDINRSSWFSVFICLSSVFTFKNQGIYQCGIFKT